jgi:hypothetical protein
MPPMAGRVPTGRTRRVRNWVIVAVILGLLASAVPLVGATVAPAPLASPAHAGPVPVAVAPTSPPRAAPPPSGVTNATIGPVFSSVTMPAAATKDIPCWNQTYLSTFYNYSYQYCYPETQSPSIVHLGNGHLGVGYSIYTTQGPICNLTALSTWTVTSIAWSHSLANASSWSTPTVLLSNSCRWPSESQPTFAAGVGGNVYGAYILSNQTQNSTAPYGDQPDFPPDLSQPDGDAIGFVHSSNNGTTWSTVTEIPHVTYAERPQIAVFGATIYVAYIFTNNGSALYPGGSYTSVPALSVDVATSTTGGLTWKSPVVLPGLNASMGNWSTDPSIAVNATGAVAVAYASNRSCVQYCYYPLYPYSDYADQIVFSESANSGSTWSAPVVAGNWTGESYSYENYNDRYYYQFEFPWMATPQTAIAFTANGQGIYIAYAGTFVKSTSIPYYNWEYSGVFAAYSANGGANWTDSVVHAEYSTSNYDQVYSPGIAVSGSTAYIAYVWLNESYCYSAPCSQFYQSASSWVASSSTGTNWSGTYSALASLEYSFYIESGFQGWESSVAIANGGTPVTATTLPGKYSFDYLGYNGTGYNYAYTYYANVSIGYAYTGPTTNVTFVEQNLSAGTTWGITVAGYILGTNQSAINVTNVPINVDISLGVLPQSGGYRQIYASELSVPSYTHFSAPQLVDVNYTAEYGVEFWIEPSYVPYAEIYIDTSTQYYDLYSGNGYSNPYPAFPWYFPENETFQFQSYGEPPITYWNGTGNSSYTGVGVLLNLTLTGPVNETAWAGSYGVYTEGFYATGLPSTSNYSFSFGGSTYSTPSSNWTYVPGTGTGGYTVTNITATSSTAGWEYFGWIPGGSNVVVVPAEPTVGFDFAYVNVASPVGTVTFQASGIGTGTVWSVEFNGTYYSSSTPWLNVSTRPGTFPWEVGPAVAANASVGYAPVGTGSTVSVTTGTTVDIAYASAYRVDVVAGEGGSVSGAGNHWLASGTAATYTAGASSGYAFGGWTGTGTGSYTGSNLTASVTANGAITESASFYPLPSARFNVTFQETGITTGAWWTVSLNGVGYSSNSTQLLVSDLLSCAAGTTGQYHESVGVAYDNDTGTTRYVAVNPPASFCTDGGLVQPLTFTPQYRVAVSTTSGGTAYLADGTTVTNTSLWANPTDTVQLEAHAGTGYVFGGWNGTGTGSYTGSSLSPPISVGGPVTEFATFVPLPPTLHPVYTETFKSSVAFPTGTSWSVHIGTGNYGGNGPTILVSGLAPGSYTATVSGATAANGLTKWSPTATTLPVTVSGNGTQPVGFGKPVFWVTIGGSTGGTEAPSSGWQSEGTSLTLNATANLGETFVNWTGTGDGNYTGNLSTTTLTVNGPLTEFATFAPVAPAVTTVTSVWSSGSTWAILGVVGLLVGLIVGIAVRRLRAEPSGGSPGPVTPWTGESPGSSGGGAGTTAGGSP